MSLLTNIQFTLTERLIFYYNLLLLFFIIIFFRSLDDAVVLISIHIVFAFLWIVICLIRQQFHSKPSQYFFFISPVILLSVFHYETGLINTLLFANYFDPFLSNADKIIFGCLPNRVLPLVISSGFTNQFFHLIYFTYYIILFAPVTYIYFKKNNQDSHNKLLFSIIFSSLIHYLFFIIFPAIGPTVDRNTFDLFTNSGGFVSIMDFLFRVGDLDGGAFPSSHIGVSVVIYLSLREEYSKFAKVILVDIMLISISTIFCCYHYGVDVIVGFFSGIVTWYLSIILYKKSKEITNP